MNKIDDEFILYCRGESGNCYKAALMLNLCALQWHPRFVNFFDDNTRPIFRERISEMGELPVIEGRNRTLSQSGVILSYLADLTGQFSGRDDNEKLEIYRWILFDNHRFTPYFATLRFMIGIRKIEENPVTEYLRLQATNALEIVNRRLQDRPFVIGDTPTIADISMAGYQYYDEETGIDRRKFPNIQAWLERLARLPNWAHPYDLMPRALPSERPGPAITSQWP